MRRTRIIPVLLLHNGGLVKTVRFRKETYVGDPINTVKIFNDKEVDEILVLDVGATMGGRAPDLRALSDLAGESFMPLGYGGGVRTVEQIRTILRTGAEKVSLNTAAIENPGLVTEAARLFGSQSIVVSIDVGKDLFGRLRVKSRRATRNTGLDPVSHAQAMERAGAGEILLTSVDRDGMFAGYDLNLVRKVSRAVGIPVVACGGARGVPDMVQAMEAGAAAVAAGSLFVFQGPHRAVLISFPSPADRRGLSPTAGK